MYFVHNWDFDLGFNAAWANPNLTCFYILTLVSTFSGDTRFDR